jgi:hypothetical protein
MAEPVRSAASADGERPPHPAAIVRYPATPAPREKFACVHTEDIARARQEIVALELRAGQYLDPMPPMETAALLLRKVEEIERQRTVIQQRIVGWEKDDGVGQALMKITGAQVRTMLSRRIGISTARAWVWRSR